MSATEQRPIRVAISGAAGRMGQELLNCLADYPELALHSAIVEPQDPRCGQEILAANGLSYQSQLEASADTAEVIVDFSSTSNALSNLQYCQRHACALVLGTTGFSAAEQSTIAAGAKQVAIFQASNMSLGVSLLAKLVEQSSAALGDSADIEIVEAHHRHKVDSPSGTALSLGRAAAAGLGRELDNQDIYQRVGNVGARPRGAIGFASIRGGDVVGEHSVHFLLAGESIKLTHTASNRALFARGALRAATFIAHKPAGLYGMNDLLGL